jgi:hypothetical protein
VVAALAILGAAGPARADDDGRVEARKLVNAGDKSLQRGDYLRRKGKAAQATAEYERALASYQKAHELTGNPQIYFVIASAEEKLERWLDADRHYRQVLAEATDAKPELRNAATARIAEVDTHLGLVTLHVNPDGAALSLDGAAIGAAPLPAPLVLAPGSYTLGIQAEGYTPLETKLVAEAGSESERSFDLEPIPVVVEAPPPLPPPRPRPEPLPAPRTTWLLVGLGGTVAFAAGASATGILAMARHDDFVDSSRSAAEREDARTSGQTLARTTDVLLVGAVAAAGFTAYYYLKVYRPAARAHARRERELRELDGSAARRAPNLALAKVLVVPYVQDGGAGLAVGGRF